MCYIKGNMKEVMHATINSLYLWDSREVLTLTSNIILLNGQPIY